MGAPNTHRCIKCRAKMRQGFDSIYCPRCGYRIKQAEDNWTKRLMRAWQLQRKGEA